ncbi:MAG: tetratricopeptide repeat protein [Deltaproteobacteria bacterium]
MSVPPPADAPAAPPAPQMDGGFDFDLPQTRAGEMGSVGSADAEGTPSLDLNIDLGISLPPEPAAAASGPADEDLDSISFLQEATRNAQPIAASEPDALEFDLDAPMAPAGASPPADALESDLDLPSAPAAATPAEEGLEVLDFIDRGEPSNGAVAAESTTRAKRYQIRRKSGKSFGPFDEETIIRMLREGQVLGNEDVSSDGEKWQILSGLPTFARAIEELMAAPPDAVKIGPSASEPGGASDKEETLRRLQELYGGRMANSAIVESVDHLAVLKRRAPFIAAGAALLLLLAIGTWLGFTVYGFFGINKFLGPPHVGKGTPAAKLLVDARAEIAKDEYASYEQALKLAQSAERLAPRAIDPKSVMAQAIFSLERLYGADEAQVAEAQNQLERAEVIGRNDPDVVLARAGLDAASGHPESARPALEALLKKDPKNGEALYLLAEGEERTNPRKATEALQRLLTLQPKSARALHALGRLATTAGKLEEAIADYRKAVAADPGHQRSSLEADFLQAQLEGGFDGVDADLRALAAGHSTLSPSERARLFALLGEDDAGHHRAKAAEDEFKQALVLDPKSGAAMAAYGRFLADQRRPTEALPLLERAVQEHPRDPDLADALARVQLGLGRYLDATRVLAQALSASPSDPRLMTLQGLAALALGKADEAENHFLAALRAAPGYEEAHVALGGLLLARGDLPKAKVELEAAVQKAPKSARAHSGLGDYLLSAGDLASARGQYEQAILLDAQSATGHFGLGRVFFRQGDLPAAERELRQAEKLDPRQPGLELELGNLLWKEGKLPEAQKALADAMEAAPQDPLPAISLGAVELAAGQIDPAINTLGTAIALSSKLPDAHYYLSKALLQRADNNRSLQEVKTAIEFDPKNADYWFVKGQGEAAIGLFDEAKKSFEQALSLRSEFPDALQQLALVEAQQGDDVDAIASYEKAMSQDPHRSALALAIGDLEAKDKQFRKAVSSYQGALDRDPSLVQAYFLIGRALDEDGRGKEAARFYDKAVEHEPKNPLPYKYLGYFYKGVGKTELAIENFKKYLELKPDAEDKDVVAEEIGFLKQG